MNFSQILTLILSAGISAIVSLIIFNIQERQKNALEIQKKRKSVLNKYREFISTSAYELQGRLFNILENRLFFYSNSDNHSYSDNIKYYTIYLIAQFFAWKEIFRKEMQYLNFQEGIDEIAILKDLDALEKLFASDNIEDENFMIFRGEQRAIGECISTFNSNIQSYECIGYSKFTELLKDKLLKDELLKDKIHESWFGILTKNIDKAIEEYHSSENFRPERLILIQRTLIDLLNTLDPDKKRFPENRDKISIDVK